LAEEERGVRDVRSGFLTFQKACKKRNTVSATNLHESTQTRLRDFDCRGLLFVALQENYGIPWRKWSYIPSKLIAQIAPDPAQRDI
jgi:hypothetical protein